MNRIEAVPTTAPPFDRRVHAMDSDGGGGVGGHGDVDPVATAAVLAHTLLNSIAVVRGGTELLARHHETLSRDERHDWYRRIDDHAEFLAIVLERVAQGRLAEALAESERGCRPRQSRSRTGRRARSSLPRA